MVKNEFSISFFTVMNEFSISFFTNSTLHFWFWKQTLSVSQTFVWRHWYTMFMVDFHRTLALGLGLSLCQIHLLAIFTLLGVCFSFPPNFSWHLYYLYPGKEDQGIEFNYYDSTEEMVKLLLKKGLILDKISIFYIWQN